MATTPTKGEAYTFSVGLIDAATGTSLRVNPTIAAGDFQISKDNGAFANLTNLPTVDPASSRLVKFDLTATEMDADKIAVQGVDQAGDEWRDIMITFDVPATNIDDIDTKLDTIDNTTQDTNSDLDVVDAKIDVINTQMRDLASRGND